MQVMTPRSWNVSHTTCVPQAHPTRKYTISTAIVDGRAKRDPRAVELTG
jgi:hypothetical protein